MTGHEIKQVFLNYFKQKGHAVVPSASLIPGNDPTLLFTNAGMVQFKDVFTGQAGRSYTRAASSQKCVRAGGKHNDLENVGRTARHHTFFEMLGNFSFGDYFKEQAIEYAWELLTKDLGLSPGKLWITIYDDDDEAGRIWRDNIGIPVERIVRCGEKDNFWAMGDVGPCGPCSEIMIDQGPELGCGKPDCAVGCECDRYLELWNLVFMQYERGADGTLAPLPKPSIDTGMGLERITAVLQGKGNNYDSDLFAPIIKQVEQLTSLTYEQQHEQDVSFRVIADHIRAIAFLISDGVMPSNEGRGYVLRRIIRRASRHGRKLGLHKPYLNQLAGVVADIMGDSFPELTLRRDFVAKVTQNEEQRFSYTLEQGMKLLDDMVGEVKERKLVSLPGAEVFRLYDTYGFPLDLTRDVLQEQGLSFNEADFKAAMQKQRDQARSQWKGVGAEVKPVYRELAQSINKTEFVGYDSIVNSANVLAIICEAEVKELSQGQGAEIILDKTPFYAEKGGQVTDTGFIVGEYANFEVTEVKETVAGLALHKGILKKGRLLKGEPVSARIDQKRRRAIALNHTATHLLHAMLREVLGDHVHQAGSMVSPDRLRFDFTHFSALKPEEWRHIEALVNEHIRSNYQVLTQEMTLEAAIEAGATALFDEKYGELVRMVSVDTVSKELCGGTHTKATGDIGLFKITAESSIAAGVRRIEALTGAEAYKYVTAQEADIKQAAQLLKASPAELLLRLEKLIADSRQQEKQIQKLQQQVAKSKVDDMSKSKRDIGGVNVISARVDGLDMARLRDLLDLTMDRLSSGVITLGSSQGDKVSLVTMVSKDLTGKLHAGNIIKEIAQIVGGNGGGRPDMAQAGGKDPAKIDEALAKVYEIIATNV